jgi:DNA-binding NarL/FixJ family response regulator
VDEPFKEQTIRIESSSALETAARHALDGRERAMAFSLDPQVLDCRSLTDIRAALDADSPEGALVGGVLLTWAGDDRGAYACFRQAREAAVAERRYELAIRILERSAHYGLLFGDLEKCRGALEQARTLAQTQRLPRERSRLAARWASLCFDSGDVAAARIALEEIAEGDETASAIAAPLRAELAQADDDVVALRRIAGEPARSFARETTDPSAVVAYAHACMIAAPADPATRTLFRRALVAASEAPTEAVVFLSLASRYGDLSEARYAIDLLGAIRAPDRRYVRAHQLLAQAYLAMDRAEREAGIRYAGDASRTFGEIGLRRWSDESMLLLVRSDRVHDPHAQSRPGRSTLTPREQQVAAYVRNGGSNAEIAKALGISEHTVERHVSSILSRLGLRSRWQIVDPSRG